MGLDMYLHRMPRIKGHTVDEVELVGHYLDWANRDPKQLDISWDDWLGRYPQEKPSEALIELYKPFYVERYWLWDEEHKYPHKSIEEQVGYWRKANQIHRWFVEHVQDGEDDCQYHHEVTREDLVELMQTCQMVIEGSECETGKVVNGYTCTDDGSFVPNYQTGMVLKDSSLAKELLPTEKGFFFGSDQYDGWYLEDLKETVRMLENVLETTDFETQAIYYRSSW